MRGLDVAQYVVDRCCRQGMSTTYIHLQKMLFLLQIEYIKETGSPLIDGEFIIDGIYPVLPEVRDEFSWYYSAPISETHYIEIPIECKQIIDPIIDSKRKKSAGALSVEIQDELGDNMKNVRILPLKLCDSLKKQTKQLDRF